MGRIAEGLGVISSAPSGGSTKVSIKAKLSDSFTRKETKMKKVWPWLHQVEACMETQPLSQTRNGFILLILFSRNTCGTSGCFIIRRHPTPLKPSLERSSNWCWTWGSHYTTWCARMRWSFWSSPKEMKEAFWPPTCTNSIRCWLWSLWKRSMRRS